MYKLFFLKPYYKSLVLLFIFCACKNREDKLFSIVDSKSSKVIFSNDVQSTEHLNIVEYLYAYNGGGVAIGDINNDGLADVYFTANQLPNTLYLNKGNFIFEDITATANAEGFSGINSWTNGVVMADVNADGFLDIYVSVVGKYKQFFGHNQLFINNGDLTFTEASKEYCLDLVGFSQQAYFFDYDLDGDLDMFQLNHAVHKPEVYQRPETRNKRDSLTGDKLFRNENNKFVDVSDEAGIYGGAAGYGLAAGISDIDNNGYADIYVSNDFHENDFLYYNNGDGTFTENGTNSLGHTSRFSMGNDISDINNDGLFDIITLDMKPYNEEIRKKSMGEAPFNIYDFRMEYGYNYQYSRNMLQLNLGKLFDKGVQFSEIGQQAGMDATDWSWSPLVADFDNDGWKDIFITNGVLHRLNDLDYINFAYNENVKHLTDLELVNKMPDGAVPNFAYKNNRKLGFEDVSNEWGINFEGYSTGAAYADLDNDGDLDIVVNNYNSEANILKNNSRESNNNNFLRVKIKGTDKNPMGIGAKVVVKTNNLEQTQEVFTARGWLSSVEPLLHFGLEKNNNINTVHISWPGGFSQDLSNVSINSTIELSIENAISLKNEEIKPSKVFQRIMASGIDFVHNEDDYNDFELERLMPYKLSTDGPKIAIGDINEDGMTDFYIGGSKGQPGELHTQIANEQQLFQKVSTKDFILDSGYEDTNAIFFDADNDGDQDLYVVSGGGGHTDPLLLADRLYINDGKGNYYRSKITSLPNSNGSVVVANDFDGDGYIDLFVGARSVTGSYGISPRSSILWNQGDLVFRSDSQTSKLLEIGMITDATFLKDSGELFLVGEWMPITILKFSGRTIQSRSIQYSSGWWNAIHAEDMDGDGDIDLLVGNNGTNSALRPTLDKPLGLYIKDFDGNSKTDPLLSYWKDNKEWLFVGLDELKGQVVPLRKQFNNYEDFSKKTLDMIITESMRADMVYKQVETFESVYISNNSGNYTLTPLPLEAQKSPIFGFATADFNGDDIKDIISIGNFYEFQPNIGRADASYGNLLTGNGNGTFIWVEPRNSGWVIPGEGRDLKLIKVANEKGKSIILVSRCNDSPLFFTY